MSTSSQQRITYAYLTSTEHSGSTLIACLLGAHPQVSTVGEFGSDFPETGKCSCGALYGECAFWRAWADRARAAGVPFELGRLNINLKPRPGGGILEDLFYQQFDSAALNGVRDLLYFPGHPLRRHAEDATERSVRLAELLCEMEGTRVFLDTTKNPLQIRFLRRHPRIHLKMIGLVRDGRGVMNSLIKKEQYSPEQAIGAWIWGNRHLERAARQCFSSEDVFRVRLEDLWRDPQGTVATMLRFLGVDETRSMDYTDRSRRHVVGNRTRHVFSGEIRQDESWRRELSAENLRLFEAKAGELNRRYGYTD